MDSPPPRRWAHVTMFAACHALSDFYATAFTPLVATFQAMFGLTVAGIAALGPVIGFFGSVMQPVFGVWSDRTDRGAMAAIGLAGSAVFIGLIGFAPNVYVLAALLALGMLGVAAFHPGAAVIVTRRGTRRSLAVAFFMTGGAVGLSLAPIAVVEVKVRLGLEWLWVLSLPALPVAAWLFATTRGEASGESKGRSLNLRALFEAGTGPVWALFAIATLRAVPITSFAYFISIVGKARGWELTSVRWVLSLFMFAGVIGGLMGGYLGDRMNRRVLMAFSSVASAPLFFAFAALEGWASVPALGGAGFVMALATPLTVSLAQELRPQSASMVSGVMMGLAWGVASLLLTAVGGLATAIGLEGALEAVAGVGAAGAVLVVFLPAAPAAEQQGHSKSQMPNAR